MSAVFGFLGFAAPATAQIRWARFLDAALAKAKAEKKVIFIALNMDGERANDQMVEDHYRDAMLVRLSQNTINLFCSNAIHKKSGAARGARAPRARVTATMTFEFGARS